MTSLVDLTGTKPIRARPVTARQQVWDTVRVSYPNLPTYGVSMFEIDTSVVILHTTGRSEMPTPSSGVEA